jgi:phage shock protein PspC (stress-responsive transcriptional regulator)|tara:strand:+ start:637 stop:969 length:333 start_codon:yes stop_codon:yes gene_type:complete
MSFEVTKILWLALPLIPIIIFLIIRKKIAPWLGLGDLRRNKDSRISGVSGMIAHLIYTVTPSSYQIMKVRFLILGVILLAPEGSGLFMYLFLWSIIPKESKKENTEVSVS